MAIVVQSSNKKERSSKIVVDGGAVAKGTNSATIIQIPIHGLVDFDVTVYNCASGAIAYTIKTAPTEVAAYFISQTQGTANSAAAGLNTIRSNHNHFLRIDVSANASVITANDIRVTITSNN